MRNSAAPRRRHFKIRSGSLGPSSATDGSAGKSDAIQSMQAAACPASVVTSRKQARLRSAAWAAVERAGYSCSISRRSAGSLAANNPESSAARRRSWADQQCSQAAVFAVLGVDVVNPYQSKRLIGPGTPDLSAPGTVRQTAASPAIPRRTSRRRRVASAPTSVPPGGATTYRVRWLRDRWWRATPDPVKRAPKPQGQVWVPQPGGMVQAVQLAHHAGYARTQPYRAANA